jgi:hypothetical protein
MVRDGGGTDGTDVEIFMSDSTFGNALTGREKRQKKHSACEKVINQIRGRDEETT